MQLIILRNQGEGVLNAKILVIHHIFELEIKSVIQIAKNKVVVRQNVSVQIHSFNFTGPYDLLHHFISLDSVVLAVQQVTAEEVISSSIQIEKHLYSSLVANDASYSTCLGLCCDLTLD